MQQGSTVADSLTTRGGCLAAVQSKPSVACEPASGGDCDHAMPIKYAAELPRCPKAGCGCLERHEPRTLTAFRLMHRPATEADFVPTVKMPDAPPARTVQCSNLALSFFNTLHKARSRYSDFIDRGGDALARFGDRIGEIGLLPSDGMLSLKPASSGHLNLYQSVEAIFTNRPIQYHSINPSSQGGANDAS